MQALLEKSCSKEHGILRVMLGITEKIIQNLILHPKDDKTIYEAEEPSRWEWEKLMTTAFYLLQLTYVIKDMC